MVEFPKRHWTLWSISDWNKALLLHYFGVRGERSDPVTQITVTSHELRKATSDLSGDPAAIEEAFIQSLRIGRAKFNQAVSSVWLDTRGRWASTELPPFLAPLILTCLVSTSIAEGVVSEGNFRKRLGVLLGYEEESFPLTDLPVLWQAFAGWLDERISKGDQYRRLILPVPEEWRRLIGVSILLAFPSRKDELHLSSILNEHGLTDRPPVRAVLKVVSAELRRFTTQFRDVFHAFERAYVTGDPAVQDHSFWAAVLQSSTIDYQRGATQRHDYDLLLIPDQDLRGELYVLSRGVPGKKKNNIVLIDPGISLGDYASVVSIEGTSIRDGMKWAAKLLLHQALDGQLPDIRRSPLWSIIGQGILLFVEMDNGMWRPTTSRPETGEVRAIVRDDVVDFFLSGFAPGSSRSGKQLPIHADWYELEPFQAGLLPEPVGRLEHIRCLQRSLVPTLITLRGGVKVDNAYLALPRAMPIVTVSNVDSVEIRPIAATSTRVAPTTTLIRSKEGEFRFAPQNPQLDGVYLLVAMRQGTAVANRQLSFRHGLIDSSYKHPATPEDWLHEGGGPSTVDLTQRWSEVSSEEDRPARIALRTFTGGNTPPEPDIAPPLGLSASDEDLEEFVDICAGLAISRTGIPEPEFIELLRSVFAVSGDLLWDVIRSWQENGAFDRASHRRWRSRVYFARPPRLLLSTDGETCLGSLSGLAPAALQRRLITEMERSGARTDARRDACAMVPAPLQFKAAHHGILHNAAAALGIETAWLQPPFTSLWPLPKVLASQSEDWLNFERVGTWDWDGGFFSERPPRRTRQTEIQWLRRSDRPDRFLVRDARGVEWCTLSRNWSLLAAHFLDGTANLLPAGTRHLVCAEPARVYLPLTLARWLWLTGDGPIGPCRFRNQPSYAYGFPTTRSRSAAIGWLRGRETFEPEVGRLAPWTVTWVLGLIRRRVPPGVKRVSIPADVAGKFAESAGLDHTSVSRLSVPPYVAGLLRRLVSEHHDPGAV
jgi:hypothetical protein